MADNVQKVFDLIKDMTVLELNDLRKKIEEEFDVKAVAAVAAPGAAGAAGAPAAASTVSVFITDPGANKIDVIKAVRELTGLGLKEAKEMAESMGKTALKEGIEEAEAKTIKEKLEAAGAVVEVK